MLLKCKHPTQQTLPQTGKERSSGAFKHNLQLPHPQDLLVTAGLTFRQWDAPAGSFEAICGGPQAGLTALPSPHTQTAALQGGSCKELSVESSNPTGSNTQTSHFPPCPPLLFPLKCPFASSFGTYRSASEKEAAPRVIRLQRVPKNKRLI